MFRLFNKKLPHCDELFVKFLSTWYPEGERPKSTRPDMYLMNGFTGQLVDLESIQNLPVDVLEQMKSLIDSMTEAALGDYQSICKSDKLDLKMLDAVDKHHDRKIIAQIIKESNPKDFSNPYLISVCEFGVLLGQILIEQEGFGWLYSSPYFHSAIVHKESGYIITVFDWAVKKFSEYGVDDGYVAKFYASLDAIKHNNKTRLLSESDFKTTLTGNKMTDVAKTGKPVVDAWLYVEKLVEEGTVLKYVFDRHLVEHVYRNDKNTIDHILLPTETDNVFIVIVVDLVKKEIRGHYRIDLNNEYGIELVNSK